MEMGLMRVWPGIDSLVEVVRPGPDAAIPDDVVARWMHEHGVAYGDRIQAIDCEVYGSDDPVTIWVVITWPLLVVGVSEPPITHSTPVRPEQVYRGRKAPQRKR